ncbi:YbhB/YbcL family Raf kinase inhibitor-like protein [Pseudodonghicola flavimaris]|uniref:YbhB/YbcL family Raf kinase inhibitor-like protein n=1 Tax=Pseudodonghicola flavimaris TaxID=3050036 RepID=A0ABT7EVQ1_9RHOB|nr:YbhB/YbcL family Raf kinase inhibitor-like protein [Pseudodonghicola flavimaris]MDK3016435.1 YbhB/YbcL family Raf kinase inhibitor-like protein [Pseudodonghicola flavimaris]
MRRTSLIAGLALVGAMASAAGAAPFRLSSSTIAEGVQMGRDQVFAGFGCSGGNLSPQLSWSDAPEGTKSFALSAYDPDAPTGSGWWHWSVVNIPADVTALEPGASGTAAMPAGAREIVNDYGVSSFGGACPPPGEVHRYVFTIHALPVETLELPETASPALVGFMVNAAELGRARITAVYTR